MSDIANNFKARLMLAWSRNDNTSKLEEEFDTFDDKTKIAVNTACAKEYQTSGNINFVKFAHGLFGRKIMEIFAKGIPDWLPVNRPMSEEEKTIVVDEVNDWLEKTKKA